MVDGAVISNDIGDRNDNIFGFELTDYVHMVKFLLHISIERMHSKSISEYSNNSRK